MHLSEKGGGSFCRDGGETERERERHTEGEREDQALCVSIVVIPATTDRPPLSGRRKHILSCSFFVQRALGPNIYSVLWVIFRLFIRQAPETNNKIN
jgi:hypothetical protein